MPGGRFLRRLLVAGTAAAACAITASSAAEGSSVQLNWTLVSTSGPAPRSMATLALAPNTADVLFGGSVDGSTNGVADTWQFDGTSWSQAHPANSPAGRVGAAMVFDSALNRTILFGGYEGGAVANDTWAWDGTNWQQLATTNAPPARALAAMTYDSTRKELVLFGGSTLTNGSASGLLSDTWAFDGDWHLLSTSGPSPRDWSALAYDSGSTDLVLYGGYDGTVLGDTWTWDGSGWTQQAPAHTPGPRYQHALAADRSMSSVVLTTGVDQNGQVVGSSWSWNGDWQQLSSLSAPSARTLSAVTYDDFRREEVLFGGTSGSQPGATLLGDTWTGQVGAPVLSVSPTSVDFGKVNALDAVYQTLMVSNSGTGILAISQLQVTGTDPQPFSVSTDGCTGAQLAAGAACQVTLRYQYSSAQTCFDPCSADLAVMASGGGGQLVPLTAIQTVPLLTRNPVSLDFGNVPIGTASAPQTVTIANAGTGDLLMTQIYTAAPAFAVSTGCPIAPAALAPGASCTLQVTFDPSAAGSQSSQVDILDNEPPGYDFVGLAGTGVPGPVTLAPAPATGVFGGTASETVTASNAGGAPLGGLLVTVSLSDGASGQATTDASGSATVAGLSLAGVHAGTYPGSVSVAFAGDADHQPATATADLTVVPAPVTVNAPTVTPLGANPAVQFSDTAAVSATATSPGGVPTGTVTFSVNGHALAPATVGSTGAAGATVHLDQSMVAGAGSYPVVAAFTPASGDFAAATASAAFSVEPESAALRYTGGFLVDSGSVPALSVVVRQGTPGDTEYVDYARVPVWARFDITGNGVSQTLFAPVADASDWATSGAGLAAATPSALGVGAYAVAVHLVPAGGAPVDSPSAYVAGDGVRIGSAVSPVTGSYTSGGGYLAADPAANTADPAGYFSFVGMSRSGQLGGSAVYVYRASLNEGGQQRDVDVWMSSTSVTSFGPAGKGAAEMAGACTLSYVDSATGALYGSAVACSYSITDAEATGSSSAQFAITITGLDGTLLHSTSGTPAAGGVRVHL